MKTITFVLMLFFSVAHAEIPIGHPKHNTYAYMPKYELISIFELLSPIWSDGHAITLVMLPWSNPVHERFITNYLGLDLQRYRENLDTTMNAGNGQIGYVLVRNIREMKSYVSRKHGSIGYTESNVLYGVSGDVVEIHTY